MSILFADSLFFLTLIIPPNSTPKLFRLSKVDISILIMLQTLSIPFNYNNNNDNNKKELYKFLPNCKNVSVTIYPHLATR